MTIASEARHGGRLDIELDVTAANAPAARTTVRVSAPGLGAAGAPVPPLAVGAVAPIPVTLPLPKSIREQDVTLTAIVDPANAVAEQREDNNRSELTVHIGRPKPLSFLGRRVWPTFVAALLALGALAFVVLFVFGPGRAIIDVRRRWTKSSDERRPPDECTHCTHYVHRTKLELKPAKRKIAHLELTLRGDDGAKPCTVEGRLVKQLNRAVRRYRHRRPSDELQDALTPVAAGLVEEIEKWLADRGAPGEVEIEAHLEGGKAKCTFTRYHCVHGKWEEEDEWELEVEDEADEPVAELPLPVASRAAAVDRLLTALTAFVARVDVPEPERPPEAHPVAHG